MEKKIKICAVSGFTSMLGGKWKLIIIDRLRKRKVLRFGFLAASIDNISRKVLTDQLKELVKDNLVIRKQYNEIPPRVEYSLTEKCEGLCDVFKSIDKWMNVK
ncbi:MAG: helix-turn-helix transcriptional regulator [Flavobacteriales bacterium]|nr:helix-turn-helix transcriptional regulator [Flavobacteriales bacterium]